MKGFDVPIPVKIINAKFAYGRLLLEVVPAGGDPRWVEGRRVTIEGHEQGS